MEYAVLTVVIVVRMAQDTSKHAGTNRLVRIISQPSKIGRASCRERV